ncbi:MAG: hypothetical protein ACI8S3_000699 [Alphaproteobacteria bacterium]|jgi:uncharacterized protein YndB with AHSA1/START domain
MTDAAISEESGGQTLTMTRRFGAPRERVYAAWADGAQVARWFGPESVTCTVHEWDARIDGQYSLTMNHADGEKTELSGTFREVSPPKRLVYTWTWGGDGAMAGRKTLLRLDFEESGDETVLHLSHTLLLDEDLAQKHSMGWSSSFNSLDAFLAA